MTDTKKIRGHQLEQVLLKSKIRNKTTENKTKKMSQAASERGEHFRHWNKDRSCSPRNYAQKANRITSLKYYMGKKQCHPQIIY